MGHEGFKLGQLPHLPGVYLTSSHLTGPLEVEVPGGCTEEEPCQEAVPPSRVLFRGRWPKTAV